MFFLMLYSKEINVENRTCTLDVLLEEDFSSNAFENTILKTRDDRRLIYAQSTKTVNYSVIGSINLLAFNNTRVLKKIRFLHEILL